MANLEPNLANLLHKLADIAKYAKSTNYLASMPPIQVGVPKVLFRHAAEDGFLLRLRPDLGGVWLFWVHRREVAALGLSGLGCVTFSVYGLGLVSYPLGVPKVLFRHAAEDGFLLRLRLDLGGVWLFWVHRREVAALGLSGLGCVTFSVYGMGLVSSPLGVPKVLFRHAAEDGFLLRLRPDLGGVCLFWVLSPSPRGCRLGFVRTRLRHVFCLRNGACLFSFRGSKGAISARCGGGFFASSEAGFRWCLAVLSPSPRGCRLGFVRARLRHVFCLRNGACLFSFRGSKGAISARCGGRFFASSEAGFRWCLAVLSPSPRGCRLGFVRARLRHVFCLRNGACLFSFKGSKGAISARCGGGIFASSEAGFRWCLAVLSPSPRGCRFGFVRARLRDVFCLRTGACLLSFRGSKGAISPRCGGRFFASSQVGFRWCLAVLSPSPRGCRFGFVRARLRHVFCLRNGTCLFSFRGSKGAISARCGGRFFASSEAGFRWCLPLLSLESIAERLPLGVCPH